MTETTPAYPFSEHECKKRASAWNDMFAEVRGDAVRFLKVWAENTPGKQSTDMVAETVRDMVKHHGAEWWVPYHFFVGMYVRNLLRQEGFGEKELMVDDLDGYYIALLEMACLDDPCWSEYI